MNKVLIRILIEQICFLELSDEAVIDSDIAVQQLESICSGFECFTKEERGIILNLISEVTPALLEGDPSDEMVSLIDELPGLLGLELVL